MVVQVAVYGLVECVHLQDLVLRELVLVIGLQRLRTDLDVTLTVTLLSARRLAGWYLAICWPRALHLRIKVVVRGRVLFHLVKLILQICILLNLVCVLL